MVRFPSIAKSVQFAVASTSGGKILLRVGDIGDTDLPVFAQILLVLFLRMTVVVWWYDRKFSKKTYVSAEG
jgi:hypothetical protein